jgi:hypothetical protein
VLATSKSFDERNDMPSFWKTRAIVVQACFIPASAAKISKRTTAKTGHKANGGLKRKSSLPDNGPAHKIASSEAKNPCIARM